MLTHNGKSHPRFLGKYTCIYVNHIYRSWSVFYWKFQYAAFAWLSNIGRWLYAYFDIYENHVDLQAYFVEKINILMVSKNDTHKSNDDLNYTFFFLMFFEFNKSMAS